MKFSGKDHHNDTVLPHRPEKRVVLLATRKILGRRFGVVFCRGSHAGDYSYPYSGRRPSRKQACMAIERMVDDKERELKRAREIVAAIRHVSIWDRMALTLADALLEARAEEIERDVGECRDVIGPDAFMCRAKIARAAELRSQKFLG